jgi:hypothetical protein
MAGAMGQAAGLAVGAAVGSVVPGVGTLLGAGIGSAVGAVGGGLYDYNQNRKISNAQSKIDTAALQLNQAQTHAKAAATGAVHAANFRQALASQVALSTMRGGSGSLATQFGNQAYRTFVEDQQAIEAGVAISDVQTKLGEADITARNSASQNIALGRAVSAFDGINLNMPRTKKGV